MTLSELDALDALSLRLRHVEATASLIADATALDRTVNDAAAGIAATLGELGDRLATITEQVRSESATA